MSVSVALSPVAILQFFDNTGKPAVGGSLQTQVGGINYATYSDSLGTIPLPNPIPLNSRGEVSTAAGASSELFLQTGVSYTFTLFDGPNGTGNQLWSVGNITTPGSANTPVSFPTSSGTANAQIITNTVPITVSKGTIQWFLPIAVNTGALTINDDNNGATSVLFLTKALVGGELQVGVPTQIISDGTNWNLVQSAKGPANDYYLDTGAVNAMVITVNMAQTAYANGMRFKVKVANTTTTATPTLNVNGLGALNIYYSDTVTGLAAGANIATGIYTYTYDSSLNSSAGGLICSDPSRITGSFTITIATGLTTTPTGTINYGIGVDGKTITAWSASTINGTSNSTGMTATGVPAAIQTVTDTEPQCVLEDNSAGTSGGIRTGASSGTWTFTKGGSATGFTNTGLKGIFIRMRIFFSND